MKNTPKRKQRNKPGVVLFTAVAVMLMLSILLTATVSFVSVNRTKTNDNYKSKQAYLTASSTLESFINQIQTDTAPTNDPTAKAQQKKAIDNGLPLHYYPVYRKALRDLKDGIEIMDQMVKAIISVPQR